MTRKYKILIIASRAVYNSGAGVHTQVIEEDSLLEAESVIASLEGESTTSINLEIIRLYEVPK